MIRTSLLFLMLCHAAMAQATFHGNIARTGVYETSGPAKLNGTKWTFKTDGPIISHRGPRRAQELRFLLERCLNRRDRYR